MKAGQTVVFGSMVFHKLIYHPNSFYFRCLHINENFLIENNILECLTGNLFIIKDDKQISNYFNKVVNLMNQEEVVAKVKYEAQLLELLACLVEQTNIPLVEPDSIKYSDTFNQILLYINVHYQEAINLNSVARYFDCTPQHISFLFKTNMEDTFRNYLNNIRIQKAIILLTSTDHKIIDVAYECGFTSENAFKNSFKKIVGITPVSYRKNNI